MCIAKPISFKCFFLTEIHYCSLPLCLLQHPSSSHVTHPAKRLPKEGSRKLQHRENWRHLAIPQPKYSCTEVALSLGSIDPLQRLVSILLSFWIWKDHGLTELCYCLMTLWHERFPPQKETILSTLCMFKLWERKCLCWAAAPLPTNIHSHTHTHTHTHTRDVTFPKLQNAFSDGWLRQALAICVLHIVQFSYEFTVCLSSQEHISRWKKNSYITKSSSHNTPMSGRNSRFIYFYLKILLLNKT